MYKLIAILILSLLFIGCMPVISADTSVSTVAESAVNIETVQETAQSTAQLSTKNVQLTAQNEQLNVQNKQLGAELQQYKELVNNLNKLLSNVYYIECKNSIGGIGNATAFSIDYNDKYYLITVGHLIENENGKFYNFKFKVNNKWIYPKLLKYEVTDTVPDYAIFYSDKITNGFIIDDDNDNPEYVLGYGSINIIKDYDNKNIEGESGSPIIDNGGETVGMVISEVPSYHTDIDIVLQAIDDIK